MTVGSPKVASNSLILVTIRGDHLINPSQGSCARRDGRVEIEFEGDKILLGGHAVACVEGSLNI